jgi:tetratricopeptide (TPR) repeat protein
MARRADEAIRRCLPPAEIAQVVGHNRLARCQRDALDRAFKEACARVVGSGKRQSGGLSNRAAALASEGATISASAVQRVEALHIDGMTVENLLDVLAGTRGDPQLIFDPQCYRRALTRVIVVTMSNGRGGAELRIDDSLLDAVHEMYHQLAPTTSDLTSHWHDWQTEQSAKAESSFRGRWTWAEGHWRELMVMVGDLAYVERVLPARAAAEAERSAETNSEHGELDRADVHFWAASAWYGRAADSTAEHIDHLTKHAYLLRRRGHPALAANRYRLAIRLQENLILGGRRNPHECIALAEIQRAFARMLQENGKLSAAECALNAAIASLHRGLPESGSETSWHLVAARIKAVLGRLCRQRGEKKRAQAVCKEACETFRGLLADDLTGEEARNELAWLVTADCRSQCYNPDEGADLANQIQRSGVTTANHLNTVGVAFYRSGQFTLAIDALEQADRLHGRENAIDHLFLALAWMNVGNEDKAREYLANVSQKPRLCDEELIRFVAEVDASLPRRATYHLPA